MQQALAELGRLQARAARAGVIGTSRVQPRLAHGARSAEPADRLGGDHAVRRSSGRRAAAAHFRDDYPDKDAGVRQGQHRRAQGGRRVDAGPPRADPRDAGRAEADHRGDEMRAIARFAGVRSRRSVRSAASGCRGHEWRRRHSESGAATPTAGSSRTTRPRWLRGMVVLDAVHQIQATQANDLAVPLELQGRQVRLVLGGDQRQAAADVHDAPQRAAARPAGHASSR